MRSRMHGTFATLLLMAPVLSIPALAIFGIPQFAPVVASPLEEDVTQQDGERRVGQSARGGDDLFGELGDAPGFGEALAEQDGAAPGRLGDSVPLTRPQTQYVEEPRSRWQEEGAGAFPRFERNLSVNAKPDPQDPLQSNEPDPESDLKTPFEDARAQARQRPDSPRRPRENDAAGLGEAAPPEPPGGLTWQTAIQQLKDLQIHDYRLQPGLGDNQFMFICSYTPSATPSICYRFEAEASDPLKAVEKVLSQVTEWRQRR